MVASQKRKRTTVKEVPGTTNTSAAKQSEITKTSDSLSQGPAGPFVTASPLLRATALPVCDSLQFDQHVTRPFCMAKQTQSVGSAIEGNVMYAAASPAQRLLPVVMPGVASEVSTLGAQASSTNECPGACLSRPVTPTLGVVTLRMLLVGTSRCRTSQSTSLQNVP